MRASLQIKYHQESEVHVTKLGDGPNSLVPSDEGFPTTRLKCFPLYSVLLAYNATTLDYLSLDSSDVPEGQVSHARFRQLVAPADPPFRAAEISLASSVSRHGLLLLLLSLSLFDRTGRECIFTDAHPLFVLALPEKGFD